MKKNPLRILWLILGFAAIGIGVVGVVLAGTSNTLSLLASFCLAKGSEKVPYMVYRHKTIQNHLDEFVQNRSMTLKTKFSLLLGIGHAALSLCSNAELVWEGIYHIPYHL